MDDPVYRFCAQSLRFTIENSASRPMGTIRLPDLPTDPTPSGTLGQDAVLVLKSPSERFFPSELSWVAEPSAPPPSPPFARQNPAARHTPFRRPPPQIGTGTTGSCNRFKRRVFEICCDSKSEDGHCQDSCPLHRSQAASGQRPSPTFRSLGGSGRPSRLASSPQSCPTSAPDAGTAAQAPLTWPAHRSRDRRAVRPASRGGSRRGGHSPSSRSTKPQTAPRRVLRCERPRRKGR